MNSVNDQRVVRLERNLRTLDQEPDKRIAYEKVLQIVADCRSLQMPVSEVLIVKPLQFTADTKTFNCPDCNKPFYTFHALCGHRRIHRKQS